MNKIIPIVGLPIVVAIVVITAMYSEVVLLPNYEGMTCTELRKAAMALLQAEALAPRSPSLRFSRSRISDSRNWNS